MSETCIESAGEGQESVPNRSDGTQCLKGRQGITTGRRSFKDDVGLCTVINLMQFPVRESVGA